MRLESAVQRHQDLVVGGVDDGAALFDHGVLGCVVHGHGAYPASSAAATASELLTQWRTIPAASDPVRTTR